ncbi:MAG: hypothetical protein IJ867_00035 [Clostridia bacterium]|nr:hypothetical protein [Clostridia bacterium]
MKKNKIILFVLALILLVGIIMVCVKGFNVSLDLRAHDTLRFIFDQKFEMSDVTKICDEVFKDKEYEIKTVEVFSDAVYIISPTITESEEKALLEKLNDLYPSAEAVISDEEASSEEGVEETTEELSIFDKLEEGSKYKFYHDAKVRIHDMVRPYIEPSVFSAVIIVIYMAIRYRKLNNKRPWITVCKTLGEMLVILLEIMAMIAIVRIPFTRTLIPILMFIIVICLCIRFSMLEKELKKLD